MNLEKKKQLVEKSKWLRHQIFELVVRAQKGHIPSSFSITELLVCLFYGDVIDTKKFKNQGEDRDRLIISKGHAAKAVYPILSDLNIIDEKELENFTKKDCLLRMYADHSITGVETVTGSLGNGYGIGAGMAYSLKHQGNSAQIYCVLGDGECYEGSVWETAMFVAHHKLCNFTTIIDNNGLCIMGKTKELLSLGDLEDKWKSFGYDVQSIDGHDVEQVMQALKSDMTDKPRTIILNTIKGKGISFMENDHLWHNRMPNEEQEKIARQELGLIP